MTSVFAVFVLTGVPSIKELGLGCAVAIALDATLVRLILVPAAMKLMGALELVDALLARPGAAQPQLRGPASASPSPEARTEPCPEIGPNTDASPAGWALRIAVADDVAFAGAARQAEMVRAGEVSPSELVQLCLERIERLDPRLNSFRKVFAEKALLEAEQAEARLKAGEERPLLGVPIAIKDEVDVAGEVRRLTAPTASPSPPTPTAEMVRRLREAGAIVVGMTLLPEMAICGFTESATYGVTRNPWDPQRTPGRLERRLRRRGGGRAGPDRLGRRRRRLDPHPGRLLRPLRPQAAARPRLARARARRLERPRRPRLRQPHVIDTALWLDVVCGGSKEPGAPPPPERPFVEAAKTPPGQAAGRLLDRGAPRGGAADRRPRSPRTRSPTPPSCCARSATRSPSRTPTGARIGNNISARFLRGVAEDRRRSAPSGAPRTPHPRLRPARQADPRQALRAGPARGREADAARVNAIFDSHDVLMTPVMGGTALPVRRWEGQGALRTVLGMSRFYPYCVPWNHLGNPAMAVPAGFAADGMPLSVQIVGRPGDEATLLSLAAQIEAERPWADSRPPIS